MKIETECSQCHRKKGHKQDCPILILSFLNGELPNSYRLPNGKIIGITQEDNTN